MFFLQNAHGAFFALAKTHLKNAPLSYYEKTHYLSPSVLDIFPFSAYDFRNIYPRLSLPFWREPCCVGTA
jgi:hypothetical protein